MAATIGRVQGYRRDGQNQAKQATRLGHGGVRVEGATWRTRVIVEVMADGSIAIDVLRDGSPIHNWRCGPELAPDEAPPDEAVGSQPEDDRR